MERETKEAIQDLREEHQKARSVNRFLRRQIVELKALVVRVRQDNEWLRAQALTTALISDECRTVGLQALAQTQLLTALVVRADTLPAFIEEALPNREAELRGVFDGRVKEKARLRGVELVMADGTGE